MRWKVLTIQWQDILIGNSYLFAPKVLPMLVPATPVDAYVSGCIKKSKNMWKGTYSFQIGNFQSRVPTYQTT